jgi:hypothetical protein
LAVLLIALLASSVFAAFTTYRPAVTPTITGNNTTNPTNNTSIRYTNNTISGGLSTIINTSFGATNNTSAGSVLSNLQNIVINGAVSPKYDYVLKTGPYAYALMDRNLVVIDTSSLKTVATVKPDKKDGHFEGVAVSPDSKFIYAAETWSEHYAEAGYETYLDYTKVIRLNASTLQPIDYFKFDYIIPRHLAVSPDGKVYLGVQDGSYPEDGGVRIMDFSQGKNWYINYNVLIMIYNFEFSPDAKHAYYSAWWECAKVHDFETAADSIYQYWLTDNCSDSYSYARTLALANNGKTLYAGVRKSNGIIAMNTDDHGMKFIMADYSPLALAASKDGNTLYAIGYITNSQDQEVYFIHKYSGLQPIGAPYDQPWELMVSTKSAFTYDSMDYITPPDGSFPINLDVSADGKYAFIATSTGQDAYNKGKGIIVYDLQYMNQIKVIDAKVSYNDIAVASDKILFAPPVDYSWAKQFAPAGSVGVLGLANSTYVKKLYPEPNAFAKYYKEEFFLLDAIFTDPLDNKTVNGSTFFLTTNSGEPISGHVSSAGNIAMLLLDSQLDEDTDYIAHLSKEIKSKDGKALYADVAWNFTTKNGTSSSGEASNSTLNFTGIQALGLANAVQLQVSNSSNGSINSSIFGKLRGRVNLSIDTDNGTATNSSSSGKTTPAGEDAKQNIEDAKQATQLNPQPEPPIPAAGDQNAQQKIEDAKQANQLNPQPEPPAPQGGNGQTPSPALNPQPSSPATAGGEHSSGSSTQEPPAPSFIDGIINFFKSLIGMQ